MASEPHTWPRLYVDARLAQGAEIRLNADQTHYILHVMRADTHDPLRLFNGLDGEWIAHIPSRMPHKKEGLALIPIEQRRSQEPEPDLWLCAAPIKRANFDFMVMKATELGVSVIQPILTERTQVRSLNLAHMRAVAIEAAEQSERLCVPEIRPLLTLSELAAAWPKDRLAVICAEFGESVPVAKAFFGLAVRKAALWTGPEGGFVLDEIAAMKAVPGALSVRLGPRILRAETAALAALACWQALCGDWRAEDAG